MSRNGRYSRYKFANKITTATTGSALDKYNKWVSKETKVTYIRAASSLPGEFLLVYLNPFAVDGIDDSYQTVISKRAFDAAEAALGDLSSLGHETLAAGEIATSANWEPSKAHVHKPGTGDGTDQTSKITGEKYKQKAGATSWVFPFGRKTATDGFLARAKEIRTAAKAKGNSVSFTPERFYV